MELENLPFSVSSLDPPNDKFIFKISCFKFPQSGQGDFSGFPRLRDYSNYKRTSVSKSGQMQWLSRISRYTFLSGFFPVPVPFFFSLFHVVFSFFSFVVSTSFDSVCVKSQVTQNTQMPQNLKKCDIS